MDEIKEEDNMDAYEDPEVEAEWYGEQWKYVVEFLRGEGLRGCVVAEEPDFCMAPYVAVWRVLNERTGKLSFWAISGDLPTDYLPLKEAGDVREAIRAFSTLWSEVAECMKQGKAHPIVTMGPPEKWQELAPLLEVRASLLAGIADDEET